MKKVMAVVLAMLMMLMLASCGQSDAEKMVGTWETTLDLKEVLQKELEAIDNYEMYKDYLDIDNFEVSFLFSFNSDKTFSFQLDEEKLTATMDAFVDKTISGLMQYVSDMYAQMGYTLSEEELAQVQATLKENIKSTDMLKGLTENSALSASGNYDAKDGKLFTYTGEINQNEYIVYELQDDTMRWTKVVGEESIFSGLSVDDLLPMELTRTVK